MSLADRLDSLSAIARTGILQPIRPDRLVKMVKGGAKWGQSSAAAVAVSAARHPHEVAVFDEHGSLTWSELDRRTDAIAGGLRSTAAAGPDAVFGVLCRNHRGFIESLVAAAKLGADAVLLNTGFAGPQLGEVARREGVTVLLADRAFDPEIEAADLTDLARFVSWDAAGGDGARGGGVTFDDLAAGAQPDLPSPRRTGEVVILSSGTTGTPKGAKRSLNNEGGPRSSGLASSLGMLRRLPIRSRETTLIAAPLFHTWGLSNLLLATAFSSPMVLLERFDPEAVLAAIETHRVGALVAVPAMLQRILDLDETVRSSHDSSSLRITVLSGSALPGGLATRWMDAFGDNLYSIYGSTEVAAVAIAGPSDLRTHPDTAGPVVPGVDVRLLDDAGERVASSTGRPGRIFVRSDLLFEGYTNGGTKEVRDGYMSTGDVGHFDADRRLYVDGREDDMIVSGGENVFPQEVEEVILDLPAVADAAVVGVADDEFGQRLRAVIVPASGASPTAEEIRDHVRSQLARFKVPRDVVFRHELPRNTTGKILRRVLVEEAEEPPA